MGAGIRIKVAGNALRTPEKVRAGRPPAGLFRRAQREEIAILRPQTLIFAAALRAAKGHQMRTC